MSDYANPGRHDPRSAPPPPVGAPPAHRSAGTRLRDVPKPFWVGGAVAVLGFFLHAYYYRIASGSGGYSCSYLDFGALVVAAVVVACVGGGWVAWANRHVARRLATPWMLACSLVLLVLAVMAGQALLGGPVSRHGPNSAQ